MSSSSPRRSRSRSCSNRLRRLAAENGDFRSYIGMGYHGCVTPPVIQRNVLENPAWYTQYTPYQSEIAQGRLEALLNFQTAVIDLTGLPLANASLLDEATAAAEAMAMLHAARPRRSQATRFFAAAGCHPQTLAVARTRARWRGWQVEVGDPASVDLTGEEYFGALLQYPDTEGNVDVGLEAFCERAGAAGVPVAVATDLLAMVQLKPPGELGARIAVGNSQRLGMPMGFGGPHAAFFACTDDYRRLIPGRIIGVARDVRGKPALRMALQTREQHIRRERATSNICTAEVLPAVVAGFYAVYHGPEGLRAIAGDIHERARSLAEAAGGAGFRVVHEQFFDTLCLAADSSRIDAVLARAAEKGINLRRLDATRLTISLDETCGDEDLRDLGRVLGAKESPPPERGGFGLRPGLVRTTPFLHHDVFHAHRSETEIQRYMRRLDARDLSLTTSMIPLGSCTMKLNAAVEMMPITWPAFARPHPFAPLEQNGGYRAVFRELEGMLAEICGMPGVSLQPNAGSQGEYAGLLAIRRYQEARGEADRRICLIPASAHGTNPASAIMAGLDVSVVACDEAGNIDLEDLRRRARSAGRSLAALMVTYPSTHGVFEEEIRTICDIVHEQGGQVYMDGANMNAMVGLCRPGEFGIDVCHLNLHKTFCIPHGGGGPGMGPIAVAEHLVPFLPGHPLAAGLPPCEGDGRPGPGGGLGGGVRQRRDPADLLGLPAPHGGGRAAPGHGGGDTQRQLHRPPPRRALPGGLQRPRGPGRPRGDLRSAELQEDRRRRGRRRGQAPDGLRLPRPHRPLPGARNGHDRAHRERIPRGAGPLLRGHDLHPAGDRRDRVRERRNRREPPDPGSTHDGRRHGRGLGPALRPGAGRPPGSVAARAQVLARRRPRRQRLRRPPAHLRLSDARGFPGWGGGGEWLNAAL